eukprot:m51a1_g677 putative pas domain-containing protein tyrosine kinase (1920) ;mRNA; r:284183-296639
MYPLSHCANVTDIVIGQSVGTSQLEQGAAQGLKAAIAEANKLTSLSLRIVQYNHSSYATLVNNTRTLVERDCAFMVAASTGTSDTDMGLLRYLESYGLPIVGPLSASPELRNISLLTANFESTDDWRAEATEPVLSTRLPLVVNVRASGVEEVNAVLTLISHDWGMLPNVGLVSHSNGFGNWAQTYANNALRAMTGLQKGLLSSIQLAQDEISDAQMDQQIDSLFSNGQPAALIVSTTPETTVHFVSRLVHSNHTIRDILVCFVAWVSSEDLELGLSDEDKALLISTGAYMLFTQNMPFPTPYNPEKSTLLQRRFANSQVPPEQRSHMALEGYLTGLFIYEVAQQAISRNGFPLTQQTFLSTVFSEVRTFNVLDMILGPYGDGGMSGGLSAQSTADECNQGVHEMYTTMYNPGGPLEPLPDGTLKFAGCTTPAWSVINLFPTAYDEMAAAVLWFKSRGISNFSVIKNDNNPYTEQCLEGLDKLTNGLSRQVFTAENAAQVILSNDEKFDAFLVLGGSFDGSSVPVSTKLRLLNSQVVSVLSLPDPSSTALEKTFKISMAPPLNLFSTTSSLRTEFSSWISAEATFGTSFMGFFAGKFLSQAVEVAKGNKPNQSISASDLIDAIYYKGVFSVGGIQLGPFRDSVEMFNVGDCGKWYIPMDPPEPTTVSDSQNTSLILGLSIGLGGGAIICIAGLSVAIWRARRTVEFLNIRRGEIELGQCLGTGRFGSMFTADWHGTAVAVRVIDKKTTPKEDQQMIKEEVLLLHNLHHPNLLMLMGYCETHTDILVVTEFMEGGTLAKFLTKEKRYASVYSLVALAFDVLKGIAYLHSCKPPIVHGCISTSNLLMDSKGTVKVSDLWYSSKRGELSSAGSGKTLKRAAWQPPEVIAGTFRTPATDVYALGTGSVVEMHQAQMGPPEIPHNASPEVADLLERCWQSQPERRPSVFQILRNWPTTFAALGKFEVPQDLIQSVGSADAGGLFSQHSGSIANNRVPKGDDSSGDYVAESMVSFMALRADSVALQIPLEPSCANVTDIVIGQSVGTSQLEQGAAQGLKAAIAEANKLTSLSLRIVQYYHDSDRMLWNNTRTMVERDCAFLVAASTGTSDTEAEVIRYLVSYGLPIVGTLTRLPLVVNVRASGVEELNTVLSLLSHDWEILCKVGLVSHNMSFGNWAQTYADDALRVMTGHSHGLLSSIQLALDERMSDAQMDQQLEALFGEGQPAALIVSTTPRTTAHFVSRLVHSKHTIGGLVMCFVAWVSPEDLELLLSDEDKAFLRRNNVYMLFTQNMPFPTPTSPDKATPLQRRFANSQVPPEQRSHMALEGYLTGWFIYEIAQQAVARNGFPLTQQTFLSTVFSEVRTFNVLGMTLGPYGDGGLSGSLSAQSKADECNQGVHEMHITMYSPGDPQEPQPGVTFKFAGCTTPEWSESSQVTVVGSFDDNYDGLDARVRSGLLAAINNHNSEGASSILLRSRYGNITDVAKDLQDSKVIAMLVSELSNPKFLEAYESVALIAPIPGYFTLNRPLFPTAYDEMAAALLWFKSRGISSIAVIRNDNNPHTEQCLEGLDKVVSVLSLSKPNSTALEKTFKISVAPPLNLFATTSDLRTEFSSWVSAEAAFDTSFMGFFVGKFLSQAVEVAKGSKPNQSISASDLIDAIYHKSVFAVGGIQLGPFRDRRTVEFLNIRRGEIELGQCLGTGRFGSMFTADWHGTAVAVRVIGKKTTPKEDQQMIKEEMDSKGTVKVSDLWYSSRKGELSSSGSGMASLSMGSVVEMRQAQMGPPEIPHNASPEVADLLERCWQPQPERRPSVFQILRNWPTTFATLGKFEVPQDLIQSVGSANAAGLFSQHSGNSANNKGPKGDDSSGDDMAASMVSFMALKEDSLALQIPLEPSSVVVHPPPAPAAKKENAVLEQPEGQSPDNNV